MKNGEQNKPNSLYSDDLTDRLLEIKAQEARRRVDRSLTLSAATAVGLSVSVFSSFYVFVEFIPDLNDQLLPLSASLIGALVAIFSIFFRAKEHARRDLSQEIYHLDDEKMRLIREWIAFERLSKVYVESELRQNAQQGLSETIEVLSASGIIGEIDKGILISALKSRNSIVHTGSSGLSPSEEILLQGRLSAINGKLFGLLSSIGSDKRRL